MEGRFFSFIGKFFLPIKKLYLLIKSITLLLLPNRPQLISTGKVGLWVAVLLPVTFLALVSLFTNLYFTPDISSKDIIMNRNRTGVVLTDRFDQAFFTFYQARHNEFVPLSEIPDHVQKAIVASEDKEFYSHQGFSVRGIVRSLINNMKRSELAYGGSTITQQLVKNSLLSPHKNFMRKFQEVILAERIEGKYSKQEILEMYINSVYFGEGAFGIGQAAEVYFDKSSSELTLAEAAILTSLLPSPSRLSPFNGDQEAVTARKNLVLQKMEEQGYIDGQTREEAVQEKQVFKSAEDNINQTAMHFALMVKDQLVAKFGEEEISRSGFRVRTSLDMDLQQKSQKIVTDHVKSLASQRATNGATVVMDPKTGEILALVGSYNWYDDKFGRVNMATYPRQPGSSFKPIVYAAALEKGLITPGSILHDQPTSFRNPDPHDTTPAYRPQNYDNRYRGNVIPRYALALSLNVPAVEIISKLGVSNTLEFSRKVGISSLSTISSDYGFSLVLGAGEITPIEMTAAYAVFANEGKRVAPTAILEIKDKFSKTIFLHDPVEERVLNEKVAFLISSFLSDNNARAEVFGNALTISRPAAVKTGTTDSYKDAWTLGYTPQIVVGVWIGNNDHKPMRAIAGSLGAAPIWRNIMEAALKGKPVAEFKVPMGVSSAWICRNNGLLLTGQSPLGVQEYFIQGTKPIGICHIPTPTPEPKKPEQEQQEPAKPEQPTPESNQPDKKPNGNNKPRDLGGQVEVEVENGDVQINL